MAAGGWLGVTCHQLTAAIFLHRGTRAHGELSWKSVVGLGVTPLATSYQPTATGLYNGYGSDALSQNGFAGFKQIEMRRRRQCAMVWK